MPTASLLILKGANQGQRIRLDRDTIVIGRNPDCDVVVPGNAVSRQHAQIVRVDDGYFVEDLKSRNQTFVNNEKVEGRLKLQDNDRIKICDFLCAFHETVLPPLPPELQPEPKQEDEENANASTVMSTMEVGISSSHVILEAQPAERLKVLLEISNSLTKTLELDPLLPKIIDNLFRIFRQADRGFVIVRDETNRRLIPKAMKTRREKDEATARFSRSIVNQCIDNAQAILSKDASTDKQFGQSQSISDFRIRSVMCTPLRGQDGKVFGVIQLDTQDRNKEFTQDDLQLLVAISNQAAVAMENAKLHEDLVERERVTREMQFAKDVQRGFLPAKVPVVAGYDFYHHYESAYEVGGDFYTFVQLPNDRLAVAVGDVAGKGVPAALLMAKLSSDVRFGLLTESDPAAAVTQINTLMHEAGLTDRFVTLALVVLDTRDHTAVAVNAGHLVPLVRRASGQLEEVGSNDATGLPLGVMEGYSYTSSRVELNAGDSMVLCTDGIIDAMNPREQLFGNERLLTTLKNGPAAAGPLGAHLLKAVTNHASGRPQNDDITLVCVGRKGGAPDTVRPGAETVPALQPA